jgi:biopolymer transport protein ExbD
MERAPATITINPDKSPAIHVITGDLTNIEIVDNLQTLSKLFAKEVIKDYVELTGDQNVDPDKLDDYMKFLREAKL